MAQHPVAASKSVVLASDHPALPGLTYSQPAVSDSVKVSPVGSAKTVTTAGTGVPLVASATPAQMLYVRAKSTNTNNIYFGNSAVDKDTSKQVVLVANQAVVVEASGGYRLDVYEFYIDADTNGEGVDFLYVA
jgi:hypothetical protein